MYTVTYSHHHPTEPSSKLVFHTRADAISQFLRMVSSGLVRCAYVKRLELVIIDHKVFRAGTIIRRATYR